MFLTLLGVIMALLSFIMDYVIEKCQTGVCFRDCVGLSVWWVGFTYLR